MSCEGVQAGAGSRARTHTPQHAGHREYAVVMEHSGAKRQRCYIVKTTIHHSRACRERKHLPPAGLAYPLWPACRVEGTRAQLQPSRDRDKGAGHADCDVSACPRARRLLSVCVPFIAREGPPHAARTWLVQRRQEPRVFTLIRRRWQVRDPPPVKSVQHL